MVTPAVSTARTAKFLASLEERRKTLRDEVEEDVGPLRGLSLEERGKVHESVCRDAMAIIRARPDAEAALAEPAGVGGWLTGTGGMDATEAAVDVERLLALMGNSLDRAMVRRELVEVVGEDDSRVGRWDALVEALG